MLVIRLQRTGRKGHAQFRVVVQDSRRTPTSGKVVAQVGTYDPHAKTISLDKERAEHYLAHGAQPSPRVMALLKAEGIKLPAWVKTTSKQEGKIRNPDKLRRNRPAEVAPEPPAESAVASVTEEAEQPTEESAPQS